MDGKGDPSFWPVFGTLTGLVLMVSCPNYSFIYFPSYYAYKSHFTQKKKKNDHTFIKKNIYIYKSYL